MSVLWTYILVLELCVCVVVFGVSVHNRITLSLITESPLATLHQDLVFLSTSTKCIRLIRSFPPRFPSN